MSALAQDARDGGRADPSLESGLGRPFLDLSIGVVFTLGSIRLDRERLRALQAGDLLVLDDEAMAPVLVRVGDRVVARARLVETGDRPGELGLELIELLGDGDAVD